MQARGRRDGLVVVDDLLQIDRAHNAVARRVHARAVDAVCVEHGHVKRVLHLRVAAQIGENALADRIVFVFQRAVDPPVRVAEIDAAQMPQQPGHAADQPPVQVGLHKLGRERIVDEFPRGIHGDALTMAAVKIAGEDFERQITGVHVRPSRLSDVAIIIGKAAAVKRSFFMQIC